MSSGESEALKRVANFFRDLGMGLGSEAIGDDGPDEH